MAKSILKNIEEKQSKDVAVKMALDYLGEDARAWYEYRKKSSFTRIVDPKSGKWVSEFTANGNKYYVRTAKEGIGVFRYGLLKEMLSVVGFDLTFDDQYRTFSEIEAGVNALAQGKPVLFRLVEKISNLKATIENGKSRKWDFSLYLCTLFIVHPNEDLTKWDEREAESKIKDWQAAKIHEHDFFLLASLWPSQLTHWWKQLQKIHNEVRKKLDLEIPDSSDMIKQAEKSSM